MRILARPSAGGVVGFFGATLMAAVIGFLVAFWPQRVALAFPFVAVVLGALALHNRTRFGVLSSTTILVVSYLALAVTGPFVSEAVASGRGVSARIVLTQPAEQGAYLVLVIAAGATVFGAWLYSVARRPSSIQSDSLSSSVVSSHRVRVGAGILSLVPLGLEVLGNGTGLLYRDDYISPHAAGDPVLIAAQTLALPAVAVLGWLTRTSASVFGRVVSLGVLALYAATLFSLGTRAFALFPLALVLGMMAAAPNARRMPLVLFATAIGSVLLLQVPLLLRGSPHHGLLPYIQVLAQGIVTLDVTGLASNVLFAFQLTGHVAFVAPPLSLDTLFVSLDPRPSGLTAWYSIEPDLHVNLYTPYNALGTLANYGWMVVIGFFIVVGAYLGHLDAHVKRLLSGGQGLAGLLLFGLACLFIVTTLQYDLRSCVRILYYACAFELALTFAQWMAHDSPYWRSSHFAFAPRPALSLRDETVASSGPH